MMPPDTSRRQWLARASCGFGGFAASALLSGATHFPAKAKNVLFLFMPGGVSHMDSFDPKPGLAAADGKISTGKRKWLKTPWTFKKYGNTGLDVSELFPHITSQVDDISVVRSMVSEFPLHARGNIFLHTGRNIGGFPSLGSWINYGLGSENKNLPGYVLLHDGAVPPGGFENFSNGFLPASHQATSMKSEGTPVDNLAPADSTAAIQRAKLDAVLRQDRAFAAAAGHDDAIESAIANQEMAYRMQSLVPDVLDLGKESEATKRLYGLDSTDKNKRLYGLQCLRARRLLESGVRFVEVISPNLFGMNGTWDQHSDLRKGHETNAFVTDQAVTALIKDLKSRGLFDETIILWAGEFGRTPDTSNGDGRDHHPACFSIWLAGGGIKRGSIYGATDELGNKVAENPVTIHDLHATMLHCLGIDHKRLIYRFGGRDVSLTDVHGRVVKEILA